MSSDTEKETLRTASLNKIGTINAVEGFDPTPFILEIGDMNNGGVRYKLPVMVQMAWFRLKYPEGRINVSVKAGKDYFLAEARVYANYKDPVEFFLAEGSAARGYIYDKPTLSPRKWAQTSAISIALRNAGFGLQYAISGESFEDYKLNELASTGFTETPATEEAEMPADDEADGKAEEKPKAKPAAKSERKPKAKPDAAALAEPQSELTPLEKAMAVLCPITKYKDKTLGEMIRIDPNALSYVAKSADKYGAEIADSAKLICVDAVQKTSA